MDSNQDLVLQAIYTVQENQVRAQEQQRIAQEQQLRFQETTEKTLTFVCAKLELIERNTITIMGSIVSDFAGISDSQKAAIEAAGNEIDSEQVVKHVTNPQFTKQVKRLKSGKLREKLVALPSFKLTALFQALGITKHGEKCAAGNWLGGIFSKIFGAHLNKEYHPSLEPLATKLLEYYFVERSNQQNRMY